MENENSFEDAQDYPGIKISVKMILKIALSTFILISFYFICFILIPYLETRLDTSEKILRYQAVKGKAEAMQAVMDNERLKAVYKQDIADGYNLMPLPDIEKMEP